MMGSLSNFMKTQRILSKRNFHFWHLASFLGQFPHCATIIARYPRWNCAGCVTAPLIPTGQSAKLYLLQLRTKGSFATLSSGIVKLQWPGLVQISLSPLHKETFLVHIWLQLQLSSCVRTTLVPSGDRARYLDTSRWLRKWCHILIPYMAPGMSPGVTGFRLLGI